MPAGRPGFFGLFSVGEMAQGSRGPRLSGLDAPAGLDGVQLHRPLRWLTTGHAQTIGPHLFRRAPRVPRRREVWTLPGGEVLDVVTLPDRPRRPGVILLHGLEAKADSGHMLGLLDAVQGAGWNGASIEFPSCGPSSERQTRLYHAGMTDVLHPVVARAKARWQTDTLAAIGVSLGGNVMLKFLGELGAGAPLAAAVAISVPYDLEVCARRLDAHGFFPWLYRERFLRTLRRKARRLTAGPEARLTARAVRGIRTFAAFDELVTAPLFGFASARDYWQQSSSLGFLPAIRRPTLLISARDDPFVDEACLPFDAAARNPHLTLWLSEWGGHVGFVTGSLRRPTYLAERLATDFLRSAGGLG